MLFFFINLRDFFYTRASKNSGSKNIDYRLSMSTLFVLHYMALWIIIDIVLKKYLHGFSVIELLRAAHLLPKILTTIAFFSPLAIVMFLLFKELKKYEVTRMDKVEERRWLFVTITIVVTGVMALMILPRFVMKILN
ncbi:hypothetical protein [Dyadobacter sp. LHD-138]|uniref:hypothetical protein n=1 Tax=Dyadobacter sp. LHD-138 TaxID=3071413 RepID=UPI0027DFC209|nr:hypothetical protein [Dyadobacter sp. LHD-138]MDQ6480582.1 hypothetical protein [Dyadobacter sp. LHD-138]